LLTLAQEPTVAVGLMIGVPEAGFDLHGEFTDAAGERFAPGTYLARAVAAQVEVVDSRGSVRASAPDLTLMPRHAEDGFFTVRAVTIGVGFHWERRQDQQFSGAIRFKADSADARGSLTVINQVPIETYLASVISSEMSATSHPELLKTHAIVSRSWLLAQLEPWRLERRQSGMTGPAGARAGELIRWYSQESHAGFDVCADDHCQRYQGVTRATTPAVSEAIRATAGEVLTYDDGLCDARFSKSCGGMTEEYRAAWDDLDVPYLRAEYDGPSFPPGYALPLTNEAHAERWILGSPPAFCRTQDPGILARVLPDFDQETVDFFRWRVTLDQEELQALLLSKLGLDCGAVVELQPMERGPSGRIVRLAVIGERASLVVGKELEIRRALSPSHLYSSAFVVQPGARRAGAPESFTLVGAGWGHGVGLCQIGAALMAEGGRSSDEILGHYYRGGQTRRLYPPRA